MASPEGWIHFLTREMTSPEGWTHFRGSEVTSPEGWAHFRGSGVASPEGWAYFRGSEVASPKGWTHFRGSEMTSPEGWIHFRGSEGGDGRGVKKIPDIVLTCIAARALRVVIPISLWVCEHLRIVRRSTLSASRGCPARDREWLCRRS